MALRRRIGPLDGVEEANCILAVGCQLVGTHMAAMSRPIYYVHGRMQLAGKLQRYIHRDETGRLCIGMKQRRRDTKGIRVKHHGCRMATLPYKRNGFFK